ncbi:MAG: tetratricopeptide repeat protein, partial [Rothia sp. (in: high G+C Gram-positive bacteria)]|uniref:tetratricopeptide repeat protein n=1 Tax=Rothia sp. (in: high G+C Gram-positive bacteria) TaxID=1885016 RepID=UPI0026DCA411
MTEPNKPLEQMTAQERLDLGMSYFEEGNFNEAIKALSSIRREEDDPETYARAQLSLGAVYKEQGKLDEAIEAW